MTFGVPVLRICQIRHASALKDGKLGAVKSASFIGKPTLMIFFRGTWCTLCMAQIKEVVLQYKEIAARV